jgi:hypothetical protein
MKEGKSTNPTFTVKPTKHIEGIIREEPLVVQGIGEQLCHSRTAHPFVVLVLVQLYRQMKNNLTSVLLRISENCLANKTKDRIKKLEVNKVLSCKLYQFSGS